MSELPKKIGRFDVVSTLGVGGMGMVYAAKDPDIGRIVAIKVLHSNGDKDALERFKNEARTIGEISHPNIVILLEFGVDDQKPFLVMEHLQGQSLEVWLLEPHKLLEHKNILINLCDALIYAHNKNILHRDLKSGNIQILPTGQAKLLDFGIAHSADTGLTATGFFIGTPQFLAPEILQDTNHSKSSDCYSLGVLAYTMLCGRNPFAGGTFESTMTRQLSLIPLPLHELNADIPIALSKVVSSYLDKNPNTRPDSPELLLKTLKQLTLDSQLNKNIHILPDFKYPANYKTTTNPGINSNSKLKVLIPIAILVLGIAGVFIVNMSKSRFVPENDFAHADISDPGLSENPVNKIPEPQDISHISDTDVETNTLTQPEPDATMVQSNLSTNQDISIDKSEKIENTPSAKPDNLTSNSHNQDSEESSNKSVDTAKIAVHKPKSQAVPQTVVSRTNPTDKVSIDNIALKDKNENKQNTPTTANSQLASTDKALKSNNNMPQKAIELPTFVLPKLSHDEDRVNLILIGNSALPRGKTKTLVIESNKDVLIQNFIVNRGRSEFSQIKVLDISKNENNRFELRIYVDADTPLGNYALVGVYEGNKTNQINLRIAR